MLAAALALAVHVALFAALGQRRLQIPAGSLTNAPAIELDESAAGETASSIPNPGDPPRDVSDDPTGATAANARPEAPPAEPPAAPPASDGDRPITMDPPPATIAVAPERTVAKKPLARRAAKEIAAVRPAKAAVVRNRARSGPGVGGSAAVSTAEAAGSSLSVGDWNSLVSAQIRRNQRYPDGARSRGEAGVANVVFSVARSGAIGAARLAASSGYPDLDAEALAAVRRSNPLPPPPGTIGAPVARNVPIRFDLR